MRKENFLGGCGIFSAWKTVIVLELSPPYSFPNHGCISVNTSANHEMNLEKRRRVISVCFKNFFFQVSILVEVWPIST